MKVRECKKCEEIFRFVDEETEWKDFGTYSMKIIRCPKCGAVSILQTVEDKNLYVNTDDRYYNY